MRLPRISNPHCHSHVLVKNGQSCSSRIKHIPYVSTKYIKSLNNFNDKIKDIHDKFIVCSHFSTYYLMENINENKKVLPVHLLFENEDKIKNSISTVEMEHQYKKLKETACHRYIIACNKFGYYLAAWSREILVNQTRLYLLESGKHTMAFKISCKQNNSDMIYVIHFFDPNKTNAIIRCECNEPGQFSIYALSHFINKAQYEDYFRISESIDIEGECLIYDCSNPCCPNPIFTTLETASVCPVSGVMMHYLLQDGGDLLAIRNIASYLPQLDDITIKQVLIAKAGDWTGLFIALQENKSQAILAYSELVSKLSEKTRQHLFPDILQAMSASNSSGLHFALMNNYAQAIAAYGTLLDCIPQELSSDRLVEIFMARNSHGTPGLYMALQNNCIDAILCYGNLLNKLPKQNRIEALCTLLIAKDEVDMPAIMVALHQDSKSTIDTYTGLLTTLSEDEYNALLSALPGDEFIAELSKEDMVLAAKYVAYLKQLQSRLVTF